VLDPGQPGHGSARRSGRVDVANQERRRSSPGPRASPTMRQSRLLELSAESPCQSSRSARRESGIGRPARENGTGGGRSTHAESITRHRSILARAVARRWWQANSWVAESPREERLDVSGHDPSKHPAEQACRWLVSARTLICSSHAAATCPSVLYRESSGTTVRPACPVSRCAHQQERIAPSQEVVEHAHSPPAGPLPRRAMNVSTAVRGSTVGSSVSAAPPWRRESSAIHLASRQWKRLKGHKCRRDHVVGSFPLQGRRGGRHRGNCSGPRHDIPTSAFRPLSSRRATTQHSLSRVLLRSASISPGSTRTSTSPADRCDRCTRSGHHAHSARGRRSDTNGWVDRRWARNEKRSTSRRVSQIATGQVRAPIHTHPARRPVRAANVIDYVGLDSVDRPPIGTSFNSSRTGCETLSGRTWSTRRRLPSGRRCFRSVGEITFALPPRQSLRLPPFAADDYETQCRRECRDLAAESRPISCQKRGG